MRIDTTLLQQSIESHHPRNRVSPHIGRINGIFSKNAFVIPISCLVASLLLSPRFFRLRNKDSARPSFSRFPKIASAALATSARDDAAAEVHIDPSPTIPLPPNPPSLFLFASLFPSRRRRNRGRGRGRRRRQHS